MGSFFLLKKVVGFCLLSEIMRGHLFKMLACLALEAFRVGWGRCSVCTYHVKKAHWAVTRRPTSVWPFCFTCYGQVHYCFNSRLPVKWKAGFFYWSYAVSNPPTLSCMAFAWKASDGMFLEKPHSAEQYNASLFVVFSLRPVSPIEWTSDVLICSLVKVYMT